MSHLPYITDLLELDAVTPSKISIGGDGVRWSCTLTDGSVDGTVQLYQRLAIWRDGDVTIGEWAAAPTSAVQLEAGAGGFVWQTAPDMQYGLLASYALTVTLAGSPAELSDAGTVSEQSAISSGLVPSGVTASIYGLAADDPIWRKMLNGTPETIELSAQESLAGREFYFEQANWGRVTFTLPTGQEWHLPDLALPILNGKGSVVRVTQTDAGRWRIEEGTPGALIRTDEFGFHPVMEPGLKLWCEGTYGIQQTRIGQADTARVTHWPCRAGCADYLHHVGTDPSSTAHKLVTDSSFPGGVALQQRTSGGVTGFLTSSYTPAGKQYSVFVVMRNNATGTSGPLFRTKSDNSESAYYVNGIYLVQPIPITAYTTTSLEVGGEAMGIGTVSLSAGAATFTHPQDEHLAVGDRLLINNTAYDISARSSATAWTVSPANTDATSRPFIRKIGMERTSRPRVVGWCSTQETGQATSATSTTLVDSTKLWPSGRWTNSKVVITGGTGAGESQTITGVTAPGTLTVASWSTQPDAGSTYRIEAVQTYASTAIAVTEMQKPSSLNNLPIPSEIVFTGSWALNIYAVLIFDGVLTNRPALLRWLAGRYPFTLVP